MTKSYITSAVQSVEPDVSPRLADHASHQPRKSQQKVTIVSHYASAHATAYRSVKSKHVLYHQPKSHRSGLCSIVSVPTNYSQRPIRTTCIPRLSEERFVGMVCSVTFVLSEKYDSDGGPLDWGVVSRAAVVAVCRRYMYTVSTPFFSLLILFRTKRHQNSVLQHPRRPKAFMPYPEGGLDPRQIATTIVSFSLALFCLPFISSEAGAKKKRKERPCAHKKRMRSLTGIKPRHLVHKH